MSVQGLKGNRNRSVLQKECESFPCRFQKCTHSAPLCVLSFGLFRGQETAQQSMQVSRQHLDGNMCPACRLPFVRSIMAPFASHLLCNSLHSRAGISHNAMAPRSRAVLPIISGDPGAAGQLRLVWLEEEASSSGS